INTSDITPEFVVCTGDIVGYPSSIDHTRYAKTLDKYLAITKTLRMPVYTIPGNHDLEGGERFKEIFQKKVGNLFFSVEKKDFLFLFLNSEDLSKIQINWLKEKVEKTSSKKKWYLCINRFFLFLLARITGLI
ncbi:MAG: metallophosphoesterase, partial [Candidatus Omnitrophica bacterium]|nr:metallophosphoesterase [Candidatus Omnitrophota bacterium]